MEPKINFVVLNTTNGQETTVTARPSTRIDKIVSAVCAQWGKCADSAQVSFGGERIGVPGSATAAEVGLEEGHIIDVSFALTGGKPVIYLFPPSESELEASVKLSLVREWAFSAIYPVVPIVPSSAGGQALEWTVKARPDGTLVEKNSELEVAYLFWEAE